MAPKTHKGKADILDGDLVNFEILRRLKLRRRDTFTIVPVSYYSNAIKSSHSAKIGQILELDRV